jgi:hypothetical protein
MSQVLQRGRQVTSTTLTIRTALAVAALVVFEVIYGAYGDPNAGHDQRHEVPVVAGIGLAVTALVFGLLVPRAMRAVEAASPTAGRWAIGFTVCAVVSLAAFWSGAPIVLGAAAALTGWTARRRALAGKAFDLAYGVGLFAVVATIVWTILSNAILSR